MGSEGGRLSWALAGLGISVLVALVVRLIWLWPPAQSVNQAPYDDEGVYIMAAQLLRQGIWPYRDYFFAHPPLGIITLLPAVSVAYTPWGSSLSFGLARLEMVGFGVATVVLVGLAGWRVWGLGGGLVAGLLLAVDPASVANSRHILLEVPMTLCLAAALLAFVQAERWRPGYLVTGLLVGLAGLIKIQALALALALVVALLLGRQWRPLGRLVLGLLLAFGALLGLALLVGPDPLIRQVILFQLLRPGDGLESLSARLGSLLGVTGLAVGLLGALLGGSLALRRGPANLSPAQRRLLLVLALWLGLGLVSFLVSRSYYQHYASQLAPGLALLAGGLGLAARRSVALGWRLGLAVSLLVLVGVAGLGLRTVIAPRPDSIFVVVARYLANAVPPTGAALTTDAQFNYLASRPLPRTEGGYLVDSYGQLVYAGLGLAEGDLLAAAATARRGRDGASVHAVMARPAAQALLRQHLAAGEVVVIHAVGRGRVTAETTAWLRERFVLVESNNRYDIYRRRS